MQDLVVYLAEMALEALSIGMLGAVRQCRIL